MPRVTGKQREERIEFAEELCALEFPTRKMVDAIRDEFGVHASTAEKYIHSARTNIAREAEKDPNKKLHYLKILRSLDLLIFECWETKQLKQLLDTLKEKAKLLGLYPESGTGDDENNPFNAKEINFNLTVDGDNVEVKKKKKG